MKSTLIRGLIFGAITWSAAAAPEMTGVMVTSERTAVTLVDAATGQQSNWIQVGDTFEGYTLKSYDAKKGLLILANAGGSLKLHLNQPAIPAAQIQLQGTIRLRDGRRVEVDQVTLTVGETSTFPLGAGVICEITPVDRKDGTFLYKMRINDPNPADGVPWQQVTSAIAPRGRGFTAVMGKFVIEFHDRS
jgi:hypothetical protein